ncbi:hypothetical protein Ccrd_019128, partial [Cynara cardunculus var. scolymus]
MTEDDCARVSMPESKPATDSSNTKQRKKRKWDQPAESLVSAGVAVPGVLPLGNMGSFMGITHPGVVPVSSASLINHFTASYGHLQQVLAPSMQQHAISLAQKIQPKIQEELIAREIVINDAESSVRYKLTKRQTQEEIQKCTGAIVITRGKYRPPNAPSDGEKPLYLHVSAGTHLETTADRIKAVDQAAAMVEEILKQGAVTNGLKVIQPFSTCVYVGFEPDPSLNIIARIRGPNDQYVNHIMHETGSTVLLRGRGSGNLGSLNSEEQQPLHLFLSSNNPKSLEHAKLLAENLLDTICAECGASRVSSCKVYGAVPPPQHLLVGVPNSAVGLENTAKITANSTSSAADFIRPPSTPLITSPGPTTVLSHGTAPQSLGGLNPGINPQSSLSHGTSYNGYGGIYPQATPLQQVALALRQSTSPVTSTVSSTQKDGNITANAYSEKERRPPQKRKFQELPVAAEGPVKTHQGFRMRRRPETGAALTNPRMVSSMPAPVKLVQPSSNGMMPPPPRNMPPPPPKFNSPTTVTKVLEGNNANKSETKPVP